MKIHIVLTKRDADIAAFKNSLPQGQWSKYVVQIITAALRDRVTDIPMQFSIEPLNENLHTKISLPEKLYERFCEKFGYEKGMRTIGIKAEIRKCIRKNLKATSVIRFSSADITDVFDRAFHHVNEKAAALDGIREKHCCTRNIIEHSTRCSTHSQTQIRKETEKMKQERILHIELGAAHADVIGWMRSLPPRTVNRTVNEILSAESRGKTARISCEFSSTKDNTPLSCRLVIRDKSALDLIAKMQKGEMKSTLVRIIRKHIRKNRVMPPEPLGIHGDLFLTVLKNFMTRMKEKEIEYTGVPNKYSKLCECYDKAYRTLASETLGCYRAVDENQGDWNLRRLDCNRIIDSVFDFVFKGEI